MIVVPGGQTPEPMRIGNSAVLALTVTPLPPPNPASVIPVAFWIGTLVVRQYSPFGAPTALETDVTFFAAESAGDAGTPWT
jgi:hypothetical protein